MGAVRFLGVTLAVALAVSLASVASGETTEIGASSVAAATKRPHPKKKPARKKRKKATRHATHVRHAPASRLNFAASASFEDGAPLVDESLLPPPSNGACPSEMASIEGRFCIDRWEASLVEITESGEVPFPYTQTIDGRTVRAISAPGLFPQGYVSGAEASEACARSGKRLCSRMEWRKACVGPRGLQYGYGNARERGRCNDAGRSPMLHVWGLTSDSPPSDWDPLKMNDPRLNALPGSLARTGSHPDCTNEYGVLDMVGNLHEWTDDPAGTFQGGYYLDTTINGEGCGYRTTAHDFGYHDYSTGFRCCADPE